MGPENNSGVRLDHHWPQSPKQYKYLKEGRRGKSREVKARERREGGGDVPGPYMECFVGRYKDHSHAGEFD